MPLRAPHAADTMPEHVGDAIPGVTLWPVAHCIILGNALSIPPMLEREGLLIEKLISKQI